MTEATLPSRWAWASIENIADVSGGITKNAAKSEGELLPYLKVANVYANELRLGHVEQIAVTRSELERVLLRAGDLLVVEGNGSIDQIGRVAMWNGAIEPCVHQNHLIKARCRDPELAPWVLYWLMSPEGRKGIVRTASSTSGLHTLSISKVAALRVPVCPPKERRQITEVLDTHLPRLDAAVKGLKRVQATLKRYRASVLKAAIEGRLVPTEAELAYKDGRAYEPATVLLERILEERRRRWEEAELARMKAAGKMPANDAWKARYTEPAAPDTSALPELPEGWCWTTAEAVGDVLLGRQRAPQYLTGAWTRPYLRVANIKDDRIDFSDIEEMDFDPQHFEKYRLLSGDILVSEGQSPHLVGQSAIFRGEIEGICFQKTLHRFRAVPGGPSPEYAQVVFRANVKSGVFLKLASITTNIAHLTLEKFEASPFPLPPAIEQERIVAEVSAQLSVVDELETSVARDLERARRLRQAILKWAFEGKLVDQDPDDEPASALLERIRAERAAAGASEYLGRTKGDAASSRPGGRGRPASSGATPRGRTKGTERSAEKRKRTR